MEYAIKKITAPLITDKIKSRMTDLSNIEIRVRHRTVIMQITRLIWLVLILLQTNNINKRILFIEKSVKGGEL